MIMAHKYNALTPPLSPIDYTKEPFTITCLQGSLDLYFARTAFSLTGTPPQTVNVDLVYSLNGGSWNAMPVYQDYDWINIGSEVVKVKQGDILKIKAGPSGNAGFTIISNGGEVNCGLFGAHYSDPKLSLSGNIMTLLNADTPPDVIQSTKCFSRSVWGAGIICPILVDSAGEIAAVSVYDISNLKLPATTLTTMCYGSMFAYNTGLTSVPLGVLTKADNLEDRCYYRMFYGCSSLNTIYCEWDPDVFSSNYTEEWLNDVASTGTFYCNEAMKAYLESGSVTRNSSTVPSGWTIELLP